MGYLNKVMVIGNLGRDPEIRALPSGQKVANFSIAVTENFKDKDGNRQDRTEWINIVFWGKQADVVERYFKKGMSIYIEGKLQTRSWDDQEGKKQYRTEVVGQTFQFLNSKQDSSGEGGSYSAPSATSSAAPSSDPFATSSAPAATLPNMEDDLPF